MTKKSDQQIDLAFLRSWIGCQETIYDAVSVDLVHRFNATFDMPTDLPQNGDKAPRLIHFCLAQPAVPTGMLGDDGHPKRGGFLPPVPLPRRMWAGGSLTFHGDLRVDDAIRRTSRIADVAVKEGRTGLLCFIAVDHTVEVDGRVLISERQDVVYRSLDAGDPQKQAASADVGSHQRSVDPSPLLLFRYSALTFNSHRIHYDRRYATKAESYLGLVIHGPLQATLLMNFATKLRGTPPAQFAFRSLSPLYDGDSFMLHAKEDSYKLKLWTARENGPVATAAEAEWN